MKSKIILTGLLAAICFAVLACNSNEKLKKGNEIVAKVEKFKNETGRLPVSFNEIGVAETESGAIYYKRESDSKYILWFGKELGESVTYDSDTKQWR